MFPSPQASPRACGVWRLDSPHRVGYSRVSPPIVIPPRSAVKGLGMRSALHTLGVLAVAVLFVPAARGDDGIEFFEKKIRPVLVEHCYKCHSAEVKKPKGKLLLDSKAGVRKGGETGPALVPGKPDESLMLKGMRHVERDFKMPPEY